MTLDSAPDASATLTPEAKSALSTTIRALRARLLTDLHDATQSAYRLSEPIERAGLMEAPRIRRQRLEKALDERARAGLAPKASSADLQAARAAERLRAEKQAAATLVNRLVLVRHLEALGLRRTPVVTGGWKSSGAKQFREVAPALKGDETDGYALLLEMVFDELAEELPGLFGAVGLTRLIPIPPQTLRHVVERLDDPALGPAWTDDTTLGWVYQYWNDPEREALDAKIAGGGKIAPDEIASKTQMFTERYMVEWLLQNSLGLLWLCMCKKHGRRAQAEDVLGPLEERRVDWRGRRERGEVPLDALMPVAPGLEDRWKYYVPQPIPEDAVASAPTSIRDVRLLDPACGSGHFLVVAFDLLAALYREEAEATGTAITDAEIAASILERNLHGVDIDPRAVQIAAAALYVKALRFARDARPRLVNLVAPALHLGRLPADDPALTALRAELREAAGIPEALTTRVISELSRVDHLGTLLKVDAALDAALEEHERLALPSPTQLDFFEPAAKKEAPLATATARASLVLRLERFLSRHTAEADLGLRLDGEELAAGLRFVRMVKEGRYDIVVGNPPYQGTSKMADAAYVAANYPRGKADIYAAFLERGLELVRPSGLSAMVTMRGWTSITQFEDLRKFLLNENGVRVLGDVGWGAFAEMTDSPILLSVTSRRPASDLSVALCPTHPTARVRSDVHYARTIAGLLAQEGRYEFRTGDFAAIDGEPVVYWWTRQLLEEYRNTPLLGESSPAKFGFNSGNNLRFLRSAWECDSSRVTADRNAWWARCITGSSGTCWFDPCDSACLWRNNGLELKMYAEFLYAAYSRQIRNEHLYFRRGIAFNKIGLTFAARLHRVSAVVESAAPSVYPADLPGVLCAMNSSLARMILESLNPTVNFGVGDVNRLPIFSVESASEIYATLDRAFTQHEGARESSVEFRRPGPSAWTYAQAWAQRAVDRSAGTPLPPYEPVHEPATPAEFVSFAFGVAMGRFGASGEGILAEAPASALPHGLLYVSAAHAEGSLAHPACAPLHAAWAAHGAAVGGKEDLGTFLRRSFFALMKARYENRPIYLPLSSAKRSIVAWVSIHRFQDDTLPTLLSDHLMPDLRRLEGELKDLTDARHGTDRKKVAAAEKRYTDAQRLRDELQEFVSRVEEIALRGPPPPDEKTPARMADARFRMDLDDGVLVNAAGLWPLLEPQWKDPKKWWRELATASGRKDYDWSHLAARYFPGRVAKKCEGDPSLAVAHGCFWRLHPKKAYAWELRLQDEIRPDFQIDEPGSDPAREAFLKSEPDAARAIEVAEEKRRARKRAKAAAAAGDRDGFTLTGLGDEAEGEGDSAVPSDDDAAGDPAADDAEEAVRAG